MDVSKLFKLTIPSGSPSEGKVLSVTSDGALTYSHDPQGDDTWKRVPAAGGNGFNLVSGRSHFALEYGPEWSGEQVYAVPYFGPGLRPKGDRRETTSHTVWYLSTDNEIYTFISGGDGLTPVRKYLWMVSDKLYVTPDEYVAERWSPIDLSEFYTPDVDKSTDRRGVTMMITTTIVLILVLLAVKYG
jgi:hypothetical protein